MTFQNLSKPTEKRNSIARNGMWFEIPKQGEPIATEKPHREPKQKVKNDPKLIAAARELRDRWLEHANSHSEALLAQGKYHEAIREFTEVVRLQPESAAAKQNLAAAKALAERRQ